MIKSIAHLADIHIRKLHRFVEYRDVFDRLYKKLEELKPDLIYIGGAIVHGKLDTSPEEIRLSSIIKAVDEKVKTLGCKKESKKGCNGKSVKCITHDLWDDLENHINKFFENNTLNDILFKEAKNNLKELKQ